MPFTLEAGERLFPERRPHAPFFRVSVQPCVFRPLRLCAGSPLTHATCRTAVSFLRSLFLPGSISVLPTIRPPYSSWTVSPQYRPDNLSPPCPPRTHTLSGLPVDSGWGPGFLACLPRALRSLPSLGCSHSCLGLSTSTSISRPTPHHSAGPSLDVLLEGSRWGTLRWEVDAHSVSCYCCQE